MINLACDLHLACVHVQARAKSAQKAHSRGTDTMRICTERILYGLSRARNGVLGGGADNGSILAESLSVEWSAR